MFKRRMADCSVLCDGKQIDFNVWPRKGESNTEACLRKAAWITGGKQCIPLRARSIDGIGKAGTRFRPFRKRDLGSHDISAAAARALRTCRLSVKEECRDACRTGIFALEQELKSSPTGKLPRVRIIRED
jgi:hypothetical protein